MQVSLQLFDHFFFVAVWKYCTTSPETRPQFSSYNAFDRFNGGSHMTASESIHLTGWQSSLSTFKSTLISFHLITTTALRSQSVTWSIPL